MIEKKYIGAWHSSVGLRATKLRHYPRKFRMTNTDILTILIDVEAI